MGLLDTPDDPNPWVQRYSFVVACVCSWSQTHSRVGAHHFAERPYAKRAKYIHGGKVRPAIQISLRYFFKWGVAWHDAGRP